MIQILGLITLILLIGILSTTVIGAYIIAFTPLQKWATDRTTRKLIPARIPAILAYFLTLIFGIGYIVYCAGLWHLDSM